MSHQFNHALLLLARQYRGMSQAEVADAAGLNQGHYSRIENGLVPDGPSSENGDRIAAALNFPRSFFYLPDALAALPLSVHPMHRKRASVGERALKQVHAELNLRLIHVRRYLSAVEIDPELPLAWIDVDEGGGPREIARKIRKAWLVPDGPISNLTACCERAGIIVVWCDLDAPIDGITMRVRDLPPCIFLNGRATADRMRFSLAHELGHIIMHRIPTDEMEDEANRFAGEFLVPEKLLTNQVIGNRVTLEFLARQKAYWRVSMAFLLFQIGALGLITRHQGEYLWKQLSGLGWRTREPSETDFAAEEPELFPKVLRLHSNDLGYDLDMLAQLIHASRDDVGRFYGPYLTEKRARLRIVK
jgi:Zn-dependent peptidase ImmA (M78 family)/transcriptional regulator with XRE-family HTH domain